MGDTHIQWTEKVWNPLRGCDKVSEGCRNCYAMHTAARFIGPGEPYEGLAKRNPVNWTGKMSLVYDKLAEPLSWRKPCRVFVNSMSDLFHEAVPNDFIAAVFGVMAACPDHTFQVLTKRPERAAEWFRWLEGMALTFGTLRVYASPFVPARFTPRMDRIHDAGWPLPNVWVGASVEDQATADARLPKLREIPAAVRFVSYEPALDAARMDLGGIAWVIAGGESGPKARPCHQEWVASAVAQCKAAGVACFVKQLGANSQCWTLPGVGPCVEESRGWNRKFRDRKGGDPAEWPRELNVRQFPTPSRTP